MRVGKMRQEKDDRDKGDNFRLNVLKNKESPVKFLVDLL